MSGIGAEIDALLVLERGRTFELRPHADGFELTGGIDGESGWFRHWPLEPSAGWIGTTDGNAMERVWVRGCAPRTVEWPSSVIEPDADLELTMPWPAPCSATMEEGGERTRYELRTSDAEPARWVAMPGASACLGLGADRTLLRIVAEAPPLRRSRESVLVRAGDHSAALQHGCLLHVERSGWLDGERGESLESAHGNAWLARSVDHELSSITVGDADEGAPVDLPDAPRADELSLWLPWPVAIRATWWREGERTLAMIRFGDVPPERWARVGDEQLWAGSSEDGELCALLFGDVEVSSPALERPGIAGDRSEDRLGDRMLESAHSIRFDLYGLAGAVGVPSGFGSSFGVPSKLAITFGDRDRGEPSITVASSRSDRHTARWEALEHLGLGDEPEAPDERPWMPVEIPVDGEPFPFDLLRLGDRWAAVGRVGRTTVWAAAEGYELEDVALEQVHDLTPHVENRRKTFAAMGLRLPPPEPAHIRARLAAAMVVLDGLMDALDRQAGAPPLGDAFTERVVEPWGGRERYERLLGLHTMLRPICGRGGGGAPVVGEDGSLTKRLSLQHAVPSDGSGTVSMTLATYRGDAPPEPEPVPDRAAIRRGARHPVEFRMVEEDRVWRVDTDLLQILIERLGTIEEVVRPLAEQVG